MCLFVYIIYVLYIYCVIIMMETPLDIHEWEPYSALDNWIKKYKEELFNYIDELPAGDFVRFIDSLWSIDYNDKVPSEWWCINVKLKILQKKEVATENGKIGTDNEDVTWINKEETKKAYDFVLKIPVWEKIVKKYVWWKELLKQKRVYESDILWTLDSLMKWLERKSEDDDVHSSEEIHSSFWMRHSDLLHCIEAFLKSNPSVCVEDSGFSFWVDGIEVEAHPVEYKWWKNLVSDNGILRALMNEKGKPGKPFNQKEL